MIIGFSGAIGSGKSHTQLKTALYYAERRRKQLVFNFRINRKALLVYARKNEMTWIERLLLSGGVSEICAPRNLQALLLPGSVVCIDEAGVFLNSRAFRDTPKELLADLAQSRKGNPETRGGVDLIWVAQFNEQIDKQVRLLTQFWIHCDGLESYNKKARRPELIWKNVFWFKAYDYQYWVTDPIARASFLKTKFKYAFKHESGPLNSNDRLLFKVFESTSRLDIKSQDRISTADRCSLDDVDMKDSFYKKQPRKYLLSPKNYSSSPTQPSTPSLSRVEGGSVISLPLVS